MFDTRLMALVNTTWQNVTMLFAFPILLVSSLSQAEDGVTFVTSLAFQNKQLTFDQQYSGTASNSAKFDANIPMVNVSFTAVMNKFFAALKIETDMANTSTSTTESDRSLLVDGMGAPAPEANLLTHPGGSIDVGRQDYSFTVGYNVWNRLNVFGGFIYGETQLKPDPFCANPFPTTPADPNNPQVSDINCSRINRSFFQYFLGDRPTGATSDPAYYVEDQPEYEHVYKEKGLFLGGSYSVPVKDLGTVAFSFAYANLDGEYRDNANDPNLGFGGVFIPFHYEGTTTGTSIAVTWTGSLGPRTAYTIDLRRQAYSLDASDQTGNLTGVKLDTDEKMIGITTGVQVYF